MKKTRISFFGLLILLSCITKKGDQTFEHEKFESNKLKKYLAIDLSDDENPKGAIITNKNLSIGHYKIKLDFPVHKVYNKKELLSTSGEYSNFTLITFNIQKGLPKYSAISFSPKFYSLSDEEIFAENLDPKVYWVKRGLSRYFIYVFHSEKKTSELNSENLKLFSELDGLEISTPDDSIGFEIENSKKTTKPDPIEISGKTFFFPGKSLKPNLKKIEVRYQIKETPLQMVFVEFLLKLFFSLISPLIGLLIINNSEIINQTLYKWTLRGCIFLTITTIAGIAVYSYFIDTAKARNSISDIGVILISSIISVLIFRIKHQREDDN